MGSALAFRGVLGGLSLLKCYPAARPNVPLVWSRPIYLEGFFSQGVERAFRPCFLVVARDLSEPFPYPNRQPDVKKNCQARCGENLVH